MCLSCTLFCCRYVISGWCHLVTFLSDGSKFLSTWYLVSLLVTCFLTNCFPDRECCGPLRHLLVTITLAITALVVYLNISLSATLFYYGSRPICRFYPVPGSAMYYLDHVDAFVNILVPLIINCLFGVFLILIKMCCIERSRDIHNQLIGHRYIIFHTILWIPYQVVQLTNTFSIMQSGRTQRSLIEFLLEELLKYVFYLAITINLFVLIISNSVFRKHLKEGLLVVFRKAWYCFCCCSDKRQSEYIEYSSRAVQTSFNETFTPISNH